GRVLARLVDDLVVGHDGQEAEELLRPVDLVLPQGGADEEAGEDGLADVGGVEQTAEAGVVELNADGAADGGLVATDEGHGRVLVSAADELDEFREGRGPTHATTPRRRKSGNVL